MIDRIERNANVILAAAMAFFKDPGPQVRPLCIQFSRKKVGGLSTSFLETPPFLISALTALFFLPTSYFLISIFFGVFLRQGCEGGLVFRILEVKISMFMICKFPGSCTGGSCHLLTIS